MKLFAHLEKSKDFWFLLCTSSIFFLLRLPSLFEPYWYGDEGIYQTMAQAMNNGSLLYRDTWDNKPPLLYTIYALFNGDQFSLRFLSIIFGILSIVVFFFLAKKLFAMPHKKEKSMYIATALFAFLFALPLFEGTIANAENFLLLPVLTAALLVTKYLEKHSAKRLFYIGFFLSLAFLIKIVAIFDFFAFTIFLLLATYTKRETILKEVVKFLPLLYGFFLPILLTFVFFALQKALPEYINAAFQQNIGYVEYSNMFIIPNGLLYIKSLILLFLVALFVYYRKTIPSVSLFVYLWVSFSLFSAFFSGRPYTHYVLVFLPAFCLFTALILTEFEKRMQQQVRVFSRLELLHIGVWALLVFLIYNKFETYRKNTAYYQNFFAYMLDKKSLTSYQQFFDPDMPKWYEVAQFLKTHTNKNDVVFVWGNPGQVYKMSETMPPGRYTVAYHITNSKKTMEETAKALEQKKPKFVVLISSQNYPFNLNSYRYVYSIQGAAVYEYNL